MLHRVIPVELHHHVSNGFPWPRITCNQLSDDVQKDTLVRRSLQNPLGNNKNHTHPTAHDDKPPNRQPGVPVPHGKDTKSHDNHGQRAVPPIWDLGV